MSTRVFAILLMAALGATAGAQSTSGNAPSASDGSGREQPSDPAVARAKQVVDQAVTAVGGLTALQSVMDVTTRGTLTLVTPMGNMNGETFSEVVFPDKTRSTLTLPMGLMAQGFDGTAGWMKMGGQVMDLPPEMLPEMRRGIITAAGVQLLRLAAAGEARVEALEPAEVGGRKTDVVSWKRGDVEMRVFFDAGTHLLAKIAYRANSPEGAKDVEILTSEFRETGGLKVPFKVVGFQGGQQYIELVATEVKLNSGIAPSGFGKPAQ
jgi:hypothetical protein